MKTNHPSPRRIAVVLLAALLCVLSCLALASCGEDVTFKTLKPQTDDTGANVLYTEVQPAVETFNFMTEVELGSGVTIAVSTDEYGSSWGLYESAAIPLSYGNNIVYLIVKKSGSVLTTHKVNIYRLRPLTVEFSTGTTAKSEMVYVNEGDLITPPEDPERAGYDFLGWAICTIGADYKWKDGVVPYEFSYPLAEDEIYPGSFADYRARFVALWKARTDVPYKIEHYIEDVTGKYTLYDTEEKTGTTDKSVSAKYKVLTEKHYKADSEHKDSVSTGKVAGDGSLVLKLYYSLERVTLRVNLEGAGTVTGAGEHRYGASSFTSTATPKTGFKLDGWYDDDGVKRSANTTYTFTCKENITARFIPDPNTAASDLFIMDGTTITGVKNTSATTLVIPASVTGIAANAFKNCTSLRAVYIPDTVTAIEDNAFYGCSENLTAYCEVSYRPSGWGTKWTMCDSYYSYYYYAQQYDWINVEWGYSFD